MIDDPVPMDRSTVRDGAYTLFESSKGSLEDDRLRIVCGHGLICKACKVTDQ